jgi:acyl-CoA synthetase (AMP-forming)/AMP-acid ligase II
MSGDLHGQGDEETKFSVTGRVWHRTGDAGRFDAAGRLWLLGRCSAKVADRRGVLYPFAVECVAHDASGVARAAFVQHQGRRLLAVEPRPAESNPDCEALRSALSWATLDEVRVIDAIPVDRRHNAKIDYPELRRRLERLA